MCTEWILTGSKGGSRGNRAEEGVEEAAAAVSDTFGHSHAWAACVDMAAEKKNNTHDATVSLWYKK